MTEVTEHDVAEAIAATKPPRQMLQPSKDAIRKTLERAYNYIDHLYRENAMLKLQLSAAQRKDKAVFGIVLVIGVALGSALTFLGAATL